MLHSMLFLLFAFVALANVVTTPSSNKGLPDIQIHLPDQMLRNIAAVPMKNVRPFQLHGGADGVNKRSGGAVKRRRRHFKGLALRPDQWASGLWPKGEVPYEISPNFTSKELSDIQWAMDAFHKETCIRFRRQAQSDMYYLSIVKNSEGLCKSFVGRQTTGEFRTPEGKFKTRITLHPKCFSRSTLLHEMMHALGFHHEHQREDRNPLIGAYRDPNPLYDYWRRLIYSRKEAYYMGNYDPESIMHYEFPNYKNYERQYFSQSDIRNINKLYNCKV